MWMRDQVIRVCERHGGLVMRRAISGLVASGLVGLALTVPSLPVAEADAPVLVADWQMNDAAGSRVMVDSSSNGLDGQISADAAAEGLTTNGEFYTWSRRCPACLPAALGRVVQVPDDDRLDISDPNAAYTLEFRFRTTHGYGNYMQKGQSTSKGGQIKVQGPGGTVQCLFKGADGTRVGTGSPTPLDDGQWHTVACVHTATRVVQYVDGVRVAIKNGSTGPINNKQPFTIGGKSNCDQVSDHVRLLLRRYRLRQSLERTGLRQRLTGGHVRCVVSGLGLLVRLDGHKRTRMEPFSRTRGTSAMAAPPPTPTRAMATPARVLFGWCSRSLTIEVRGTARRGM